MVGMITATVQELAAFRRVFGTQGGGIMEPCTGKIGSHDFVMMQCGAGKVNAAMCAQKLIDSFHPDELIMVGVGGTLRSDLKLGDILIAKDVLQHDFDTTFFGDKPGEIYVFGKPMFSFQSDPTLVSRAQEAARSLGYRAFTGRVVTGDQFIASHEKKEALAKEFSGDCAEMEGGAVGQVCYVNRVPFLILRAISDESPFDYLKFCEQAAEKAVSMIRTMYEEA